MQESESNRLEPKESVSSNKRTKYRKDILNLKLIEKERKMIKMCFIEAIKIKDISKKIRVSTRSIDRTLRKLRNNNMKVAGINSNPSWTSSYSPQQISYLDQISKQNESIPLSIRDRLEVMNEAFPEKTLSIHTIRRMLLKLVYTKKLLKAVPDKTNQSINKCHRIIVVGKILEMIASGKRMISLDEAVIDAGWLPLHGYSLKRQRAVVPREKQKKSIYLIMAITSDGILAFQVTRSPINTYIFINFLITSTMKYKRYTWVL